MQGIVWLVDRAEAFLGLFGVFCIFNEVHFVSWGSSNDVVEGRFIAFDPWFSVLFSLFMFGCIAGVADRCDNIVWVKAMISGSFA